MTAVELYSIQTISVYIILAVFKALSKSVRTIASL